MASDELCKLWEAMQLAVRSADWPEAKRNAVELEQRLAAIARDRSRPGPTRETARKVHRDGLFAIGWQHFLGAPADVQDALRRYNATLHKIPGGVGPQPARS